MMWAQAAPSQQLGASFGAAPLLATALVVTAAVVGVLLWWWRQRAGRSAATAATCGKCGYIVSGLPTFTCPECGSDLRVVGIVPVREAREPVRWPRARLAAMLGAWTAGCAVLYAVVWAGSRASAPGSLAGQWDLGVVDGHWWPYRGRWEHSVEFRPRSDLYRRAIVTEERRGAFTGWRSNPAGADGTVVAPGALEGWELTVRMERMDGTFAALAVDPRNNLAWRVTEGPATGQAGPGPAHATAVWGWMVGSGVMAPSPAVQTEAGALADLLEEAAKAQAAAPLAGTVGRLERIAVKQRNEALDRGRDYAFATTQGAATNDVRPAVAIERVGVPVCGVVWVGGAWWIWRRRKSRS